MNRKDEYDEIYLKDGKFGFEHMDTDYDDIC